MSQPIPDLKVYNDTENSHVVFKDVYAYFDKNVLRSVGVFIGCTDWKQDLSLLEAYSMPVVVCDPLNHQAEWREAVETKRVKLMEWLNYLKSNECGQYFVNPKWIAPSTDFPGVVNGTREIEIEGEKHSVNVVSWTSLLDRANTLRGNSKAAEPYFAVCRIALPEHEVEVLYSLLSTSYRPALLYVRWSHSPDERQLQCEAAGHLQTAGYRLLAVRNGYYLYQYTGQDVYSCCSWTTPTMAHPFLDLMTSQVKEVLSQMKQSSKDSQHLNTPESTDSASGSAE